MCESVKMRRIKLSAGVSKPSISRQGRRELRRRSDDKVNLQLASSSLGPTSKTFVYDDRSLDPSAYSAQANRVHCHDGLNEPQQRASDRTRRAR